MKKTYTEDYEKSFHKFERQIDKLHNEIMSIAEDTDDPEKSAELASLAKESLYQSTIAFLLPKAVWYLAHICDKLDTLEKEKIEVSGEMDKYERRRANDNN